MKKNLSIILLVISALCLLTYVYTDSVCTERILIEELKQDLRDNGKLDCLRKPLDPRKDRPETETEKKQRLEAVWDTDCSFECDYNWIALLEPTFGLKSGLFDKDGTPVEGNSDEEADMCELIRSLIAGGIYDGVKLEDIKETVFDDINCPGEEGENEICAANGGSAGQSYAWTILLEGGSIKAGDSPKWELDSASKLYINSKK